MRWETELRASQQQLSHLHSESQRLVVELKEERGKTERLQGLLHEATSHQITLQHQKDTLQEKVDQVSCHHGNQLKVNIIYWRDMCLFDTTLFCNYNYHSIASTFI